MQLLYRSHFYANTGPRFVAFYLASLDKLELIMAPPSNKWQHVGAKMW